MSETKTWRPRPPAGDIVNELKRFCFWPGCAEWFGVMEVHEPGWIGRGPHLCPQHAATGHFPTRRDLVIVERSPQRRRALVVSAPTCYGCPWEDMPRQTLGEVHEAWQVHAARLEEQPRCLETRLSRLP